MHHDHAKHFDIFCRATPFNHDSKLRLRELALDKMATSIISEEAVFPISLCNSPSGSAIVPNFESDQQGVSAEIALNEEGKSGDYM